MDANGNDVKNVGSFSSVEQELSRIPTPIVRLETSDNSTNINQSILFPWETAGLIDTGTYSYVSGDRHLTVDETGTYEVQGVIATDTGANSQVRDSINTALYKNRTSSGTGGTKLKSAGRSGYVRNASGHSLSSIHISWIGELVAGDTLACQMSQGGNSGTRHCITSDTNIYVKKIPRP